MGKSKTLCAVICCAALIFTTGCQDSRPAVEVDFGKMVSQKPKAGRGDKEEPEIVAAIASILSAKESFVYYNDLVTYLGKKLGIPIRSDYCEKYRDVYHLFEQEKVHLAFICSALYTLGERNNLMELLVAPRIRGKEKYQAYIIVPRSSPAGKFGDLKGKSFVFTDELSLTGHFYPLYRSDRKKEMWRETFFSGSHDYSIQMVNRGTVEGASVDGLIYDDLTLTRPRETANTRIIEKSEEFGIPPVVVHPAISAGLKKKLRTAFLEMSADPEGSRILKLLHIEKFIIPDQKNYASIYRMVPGTVAQ